jgi:hypothetical protein
MERLQRRVCRMEAIRSLCHLLRYLLSFQLPGFLHAYNHRWSGFRQTSVPANDGTTLRRGIRSHDSRLLVCRSLQCVSQIACLSRKCSRSFLGGHSIQPDWPPLVLVAFLPLQSYLHRPTRYVRSRVTSYSKGATTKFSLSQARYGCLIVATTGAFSCIPPLLGWLSGNLQNTAHVGIAIALNIAWGTPGQITGVWIYKSSEKLQGYPTGHWVNACLLFFVAVACLGLRTYYQVLNKRILRQDALAKIFRY